MLILHYTGIPRPRPRSLGCVRRKPGSSHYFVVSEGRITSLWPESLRAWHGRSGTLEGRHRHPIRPVSESRSPIQVDAGGSPPFEAA